MKSLAIVNGDLALGPGGFATLTGTRKTYQDLSILVREPYGEDRFHPQWGGLLNDYIGQQINSLSMAHVRGEVQRLIQNFIIKQARQLAADRAMGRRPRFNPGEVVEAIENIKIQQSFDRLNVKVTVRTVSGETLDILRSVEI